VLLVGLFACSRRAAPQSDGGAPALLELRGPEGELRFALHRTAEGFRFVDAAAGEVQLQPDPTGGARALQALDPQRGRLQVRPREGGGLDVRGSGGLRLRWTREQAGDQQRRGELWRLGDGAGIPLYRLRNDGEEIVAHDAGGLVVLRARHSGGRIVISDRDGRRLALVVGDLPLVTAALAALPGVEAADRALLLTAGL
jgi:hypothetical protein